MEIKINKSARQCGACGAPFTHEQPIVSCMTRGPEGLVRQDYCPSCGQGERTAEAFCVWSAHFLDPQVLDQQPPESFSPLRQTFYEAAEREDRKSVALAYLSGQLLRRQRVLRFIKQTTDPDTDAVTFLFHDRIGNKLIEVSDPNLTTGELEQARKGLLARLAELEGTLDEAENAAEQHGESETEYAQA